jgi:hypothetical protein
MQVQVLESAAMFLIRMMMIFPDPDLMAAVCPNKKKGRPNQRWTFRALQMFVHQYPDISATHV